MSYHPTPVVILNPLENIPWHVRSGGTLGQDFLDGGAPSIDTGGGGGDAGVVPIPPLDLSAPLPPPVDYTVPPPPDITSGTPSGPSLAPVIPGTTEFGIPTLVPPTYAPSAPPTPSFWSRVRGGASTALRAASPFLGPFGIATAVAGGAIAPSAGGGGAAAPSGGAPSYAPVPGGGFIFPSDSGLPSFSGGPIGGGGGVSYSIPQVTQAFLPTGTPAPTTVSAAALPAATPSWLSWFTESTIIAGVPNWAIAGVVGVFAFALIGSGGSSRGRRR